MYKIMRLWRSLLVVSLSFGPLPLGAQDRSAVNRLLDRVVQHEQEFLKNLRAHSPQKFAVRFHVKQRLKS